MGEELLILRLRKLLTGNPELGYLHAQVKDKRDSFGIGHKRVPHLVPRVRNELEVSVVRCIEGDEELLRGPAMPTINASSFDVSEPTDGMQVGATDDLLGDLPAQYEDRREKWNSIGIESEYFSSAKRSKHWWEARAKPLKGASAVAPSGNEDPFASAVAQFAEEDSLAEAIMSNYTASLAVDDSRPTCFPSNFTSAIVHDSPGCYMGHMQATEASDKMRFLATVGVLCCFVALHGCASCPRRLTSGDIGRRASSRRVRARNSRRECAIGEMCS